MSIVPRIGLLSDSHGQAAVTQRAVQLLVEQGAAVLLHMGDVGTIEVIDALAAAGPDGQGQIEAHLVFGNCDWDAAALQRYAGQLGVQVDHPVGRLDYDGGELLFMHGHDNAAMRQGLEQQVRWLCYGHTHEQADSRHGPTRLINPGALHRAAVYTVATLDTENDQLSFFTVPKDG